MFIYIPIIFFALCALIIIEKKIYRNWYWLGGFLGGIVLFSIFIIDIVTFRVAAVLLFSPYCIGGGLLGAFLIGFSVLSLSYAVKKRKELKIKMLIYILIGIMLLPISFFAFLLTLGIFCIPS